MTAHRTFVFADGGELSVACHDCDWTDSGFGHSEQAAPVRRVHELETRVAELEGELASARAGLLLLSDLATTTAAVSGLEGDERRAVLGRLADEQRAGRRLHRIDGGAA